MPTLIPQVDAHEPKAPFAWTCSDCDAVFSYSHLTSSLDGEIQKIEHAFHAHCREKHPAYPSMRKYTCHRSKDYSPLDGMSNSVGVMIKIDAMPPTIAITTPSSGAVYLANKVLNAAYTCNDKGSFNLSPQNRPVDAPQCLSWAFA